MLSQADAGDETPATTIASTTTLAIRDVCVADIADPGDR